MQIRMILMYKLPYHAHERKATTGAPITKETPMTAYFAARFTVKDPEAIAEYSKAAGPIIAEHGGKLLFKGGADATLSGETAQPNIAMFAFPDKEAITTFFNSPDYQALTALREKGADMILSAHESA
jgi:uncharacterized protein (DUF1330 family)